MSLIPEPYLLLGKIGAVAALFVGAYATGHHQGENAVQAVWDSSKAQSLQAQNKLISDHAQEIADLQKKHDADNIKVSEDHEQALQTLNAKYDSAVAANHASGGLRVSRSICSGPATTGTETASNGGHNETASASVELPNDVTERLFRLARQADEVTEQARACQNWIVKNGFYGTPLPR